MKSKKHKYIRIKNEENITKRSRNRENHCNYWWC